MNHLPSGDAWLIVAARYWRRWVRLAACHLLVLSQAFGAPGDLDPTFGSGGKVITAVGSGNDRGNSVAVQSDGKIVVAGYSSNGSNYDFALVRYTATGALDVSFGSGGKVSTPIGSSTDEGNSMALQSDGRIVVAGSTFNGSYTDFALARCTTSGALDASFGSGGKVITAISTGDDSVRSVAVQSDGKIVVAGSSVTATGYSDFALARYTTTGALDTSFSFDGKVTTPIGSGDDQGKSVALQSDGKIVVAGYAVGGTSYDFALARYTAAGALDASFGNGGKVTTDFGSNTDDYGTSVAVQGDGKIIVAGYSRTAFDYEFALVRYTTAGALDASFGSAGKVITDFAGNDDYGNSMAVQSDGKIIVAGYSYYGDNFEVARYTAEGALDPSFGSGGKLTTPVGSGVGNSVALQSDGKIIVAGSSFNGSNDDFALVRYQVSAGVPMVTTLPATAISTTSATLHGTVNAGGGMTTAQFEYGTTISYGSTANVTLSPDDSNSAQNVSAALSGLMPLTTYHYRLTATNSAGTSHSGDATFATVSRDRVDLLNLVLSSGTLSPAFGSATTNYTASVPYTIPSVIVTPTAANAHASINVNGVSVASESTSGAISLAIGTSLINVVVTAEDGTATKTYTVSIGRAAPSPGDLDPTFGSGGKVITDFGSIVDLGHSMAVQSDGKIIVAGWTGGGFALARYTALGTLDMSFGSGGKVTGSGFRVNSVALQSDGKIVVAGDNGNFVLARYTTEGILDTSFGSGGNVTTHLGTKTAFAYSVAVQSDGKILLAGQKLDVVPGQPNMSDYYFVLVRYTAAGALDTGFGNGGTVTPFGPSRSENAGRSIAVQSDGKIVVAGDSYNGTNSDFALVRYTAAGALDASFGNGGKVTTAIGSGDDRGNSVALQSDGKIVVAGYSSTDFALVRYTAAGALDTSFGSGGKVTSAIGPDDGYSVTVQNDGKIIVAGDSATGRVKFALVRCTATGALDTSFGSGGQVITAIGSAHAYGKSVALQSDGKIVVAGYTFDGSNSDFALARYEASGLASLANWRLTYFGTANNSGDAADSAAPDGDGIVNLIKYGLVIVPGTSGASSLPQGERKVYAEGERLALVFLHDPARNDISLEVQAADHPEGPWTTVASSAGGALFGRRLRERDGRRRWTQHRRGARPREPRRRTASLYADQGDALSWSNADEFSHGCTWRGLPGHLFSRG